MLKYVVGDVDIFNPLDGKLDQCIEYFVKFYGEKYRERITNRLKNTTYLFLGEFSPLYKYSTGSSIVSHFKELKKNVVRDFFSTYNIHSNIDFLYTTFVEMIADVKNGGRRLSVWSAKNLAYLLDALDLKKFPEPKPAFEQYRAFVLSALKDKKISRELHIKLREMSETWYKYYQKTYEGWDEVLDSVEKTFNDLESDMFEKSNSRDAQIDEFILNYIFTKRNIDLRNNKDKINLIETFKDILEKNDDFVTQYDIEQRIKLYKALGFEGEKYKSFKKNPELIKFFGEQSLYDGYDYIKMMANIKISKSCPYIQHGVEIIKKSPIMGSNILFTTMLQNFVIDNFNTVGCMYAMHSKENEIHCLCITPQYFNLDTSALIHEMNHIIESDILQINGYIVDTKIGFDSYEDTSRRYTPLNEVINDYLALKVYDLCKQDGFSIGNAKFTRSDYSKAFPLLKDFLDENLQDIIECRMSEDRLKFANKIGMKNFNKLADATKKIFDIGSSIEINEAYYELKACTNSADPEANFDILSENAKIVAKCMVDVYNVRKSIARKKENKLLQEGHGKEQG